MTEDAQVELRQACRRAVEELLTLYDWQLLQVEEWVERAYQRLVEQKADTPLKGAWGAYSIVLHEACRGATKEHQERAYTELFDYLVRRCRRWAGDEVRAHHMELAQNTLEAVFWSIDKCREPAAFLYFALGYLRNEIKRARSDKARSMSPIDPERAGGQEPEKPYQDMAALERLGTLIDAFLARYPRKKRQLDALLLNYYVGLKDEDIAHLLDTSPGNVSVLRLRARKILFDDADWRTLAEELGILPDADGSEGNEGNEGNEGDGAEV